MEVIMYLIFTVCWWFASFSFLIPFLILLQLNKTFKEKWLIFFFTKVMAPRFGHRFEAIRKQLFLHLEEHLSKRNKSVPLKVLEIGIGLGANLQYYPENSHLTALDINESFIQQFNKNMKNYPQVNLDGIVVNYAEDMRDISSDSFDVVVCTHVLCSVKSADLTLKEVKRVLKIGGKFVFLEHIAARKTQASYLVQIFAYPLWALYFDGCRLNRKSDDLIKKSGFSDVQCELACPSPFPLFLRPHISGVATK